MNPKKSLVIIMLLVVCSWWLGAAQGDSVDKTYQRIRHAELKYGVEERILSFVHEGNTIVCTLALPKINKKCPIVILMPGFTGPRDEEIIPGTEERVFGRTSRILAGYGIASFRFDWRGYNESEGNFYDACFTTEVSDTIAAIDFICTELRHHVDSTKIGILGFSQGGLIGTLTAAKDKRVDTLVLWSAPTNPAMNWSMLIPMDTIVQGVKLPDGGWMETPIVVDGQIFCYLPLGKNFFKDLIKANPPAELQKFKKPTLYLTGLKDTIVWPQPLMGEAYMRYHEGPHKIVTIDADHEFDYWDGPVAEKLTDAIYWSTAWIIEIL